MGIGSVESKRGPEVVERHRGLVGRTALVSVLTLASRLLGFVREVVTASIFGDASAISDAFFTAWRVPNLFRRLCGEGALSTSLQSVLTETDADRGAEAGRRLFVRTLTVAAIGLSVLCVVGMFGIAALPDRMPWTGWAWFGADPGPVRDLCVRLFPYVLLVCLAALCGGALQVRGHFAAPNTAPAVMNLVWIAGLLVTAFAFAGAETGLFDVQWEMARWIAWGVLVAGLLQLAILVPPLLSRGLLMSRASGPNRRSAPKGSVSTVLKTALPLALGAAVYQINVLVDGLMAEGLLRDGGPTALYYANRVQQFPLALVATAATTALFPSLKAHAHLGELRTVRNLYGRAQMAILFLALPASVGLYVLAEPISEALFLHGSYGMDGTVRIESALEMLAIALIPAGASGLCGRTFIALGDYRTPVRIASAFLIVNAGLNVLFVHRWGFDVEGLALATAVTSWGSLVWLSASLRLRIGAAFRPVELGRRILAMTVSAAVCGAVAGLVAFVVPWSSDSAWRGLGMGGLLGAGAFFVCARALRLEEWREFAQRFRRFRG
ncbi:MAG: murein biosynthesis integral membrane protein MurJ [Planctomycetes bacterium]|jgi:putative peptidoglycan lipid II flippase|nr:murein biosynthesis integral membrane protein MurJ [Planctomycetota bacterium]